MANNEILSHLSKVGMWKVPFLTISLKPTCQGVPMYDAYERDIAVLNLFFGDSTVFGRWLPFDIDLTIVAQSTRGRRRWQVLNSSPTSVDFVASALALALSLLLRSFTGSPSGFSQVLQNIPANRLKLVSQQSSIVSDEDAILWKSNWKTVLTLFSWQRLLNHNIKINKKGILYSNYHNRFMSGRNMFSENAER